MRKSLFIFVLLLSLMPASAFADTDDFIFTDPAANTYSGRAEASDLIANLDFDDLPDGFWAKDAVVRGGALNLIKGYGDTFNPSAPVGNGEAIGYLLRAINMEELSHDAALRLRNTLPANTPIMTLWELGYLSQALDIGLITQDQFNDAAAQDQTLLDPAANFIRGAPVTREQAADWILRTLQGVNAAVFQLGRTQQSIYRFADWQDINPEWINAVEIMTEAQIMNGDGDNRFRPKASLTRAEMAQVLKNMDVFYYMLIGVQKKNGTIGGIRDAQNVTTGSAGLNRDIYVRAADGKIDVLRYSLTRSSSPASGSTDAVVLRDGIVSGLSSLREGDEIEYLVRTGDYTLLYVQAVNSLYLSMKTVSGALRSVDMNKGTITIRDAANKTYEYTMAANLYGMDDNAAYIRFAKQKRDPSALPVGSRVELSLKNNIVDSIEFLGEPTLVNETYGIVLENNPALGYISILSQDREILDKRYFSGSVFAERKANYDTADETGYIDSMFKTSGFDPTDAGVKSVSAGDIVSFRTDPADSDILTEIYAYADYRAVFGKIKEFRRHGRMSDMLIEYEDDQTSWYTAADSVYISKSGNPANGADIKPGDWVKMLVCSVVPEPGRILETVKEINIEGGAHYISRIVMGRLGGIDAAQNTLILQNTRTLSKTGWVNAKQVEQFLLAGNDTEYYYGNMRVCADYAEKRLRRAQGQVYAALEDNYAGERVKKVTFRSGRDELLAPDVVLGADGSGRFYISGNRAYIFADPGAIVRRHGRLAGARDILPSDYAAISLNGADAAAVVDVAPLPDTSGIMIARGRVSAVNEGQGFRVESMSLLHGTQWSYTPVRRLYAIDGETLFVSMDGIQPAYPFRGYTGNSAVGKVFNIVLDGARAARVVDAPYCDESVRGVVYQNESGILSLRDTAYYENDTGKWRLISNNNATAAVKLAPNAIIVTENTVTEWQSLRPGDYVSVLTNSLPAQIAPGMEITGYIVSVER
ncbi:MAG: S-layer homology domain-containing protein [Clostridiales bacterium]|jgi:hypothetical protein|nr:S-layer homology domain-containing protein [Clostridiales bacterium]